LIKIISINNKKITRLQMMMKIKMKMNRILMMEIITKKNKIIILIEKKNWTKNS
jgi:hypothetical protein